MMRLWDKKHKHDRLTVFSPENIPGNLYGAFAFHGAPGVFRE